LNEILQGLPGTFGFRIQAGELREQLAAGEEGKKNKKKKRQSFEVSTAVKPECAHLARLVTSGRGARSVEESRGLKCGQVPGGSSPPFVWF
jgi:hypothetical protein